MKRIIGIFSLIMLLFSTFSPVITYANSEVESDSENEIITVDEIQEDDTLTEDLEEEESLNSEEIVQSEQIIEEAQTETGEDTPLEANSGVIENDETIENTAEDKEFNEENIENEMNESEEIEGEDSYEGVQVHVYAQEGAFPKGTTLEINPIKEKAAISDIQDIIEEQQEIERTEKLIAFDITFLYSGEEIQPVEGKTVQVTFNYENNNILKAAEENEDQEVKVYHLNDIDDNGEKIEEIKETKVEDVEINEEKSEEENVIVVDAESFSVYTIVVQVIEEQLINFEYGEISIEDPEHPGTGITIMDRNLGAKVAGTGDSSYGYYYQWGNNYGFPTMGNVATSSDPVNVSDLNSYSGSTFRSGYSWMSEPNNFVLWIGDNKQGPCPEGWHIPTIQEWNQLVDYYIKANYPDVELSTDPTGNKHIDNGIVAKGFSNKFYIPRAGYRKYNTSTRENVDFDGYYWSSSNNLGSSSKLYFRITNSYLYMHHYEYTSQGYSVRCFKDTYSGTGKTFKITYEYNGGFGSVPITVISGGKAEKPTNPVRDNSIFSGWYLKGATTEFDFNTPIESDITLYAKRECEEGYISKGNSCVKDVNGLETTLIKGEDFNKIIKGLAKQATVTDIFAEDNMIVRIRRANSIPDGVTTTDIQTAGSIPVKAWYKQGTLRYYSEAGTIYLNENSANMFNGLKELTSIDFANFDTSKVVMMYGLFYSCSSLKELDLSNFVTSKVTNMSNMFNSCSSLKELDLSRFNTSIVTDMSAMFDGCSSLKELDLSNFDTKNVTNMGAMFNGCSSLKELDLSRFNTSNVINMSSMFFDCISLRELDLSNFDTKNVNGVGGLLHGASGLETLNLNGWDLTKAGGLGGALYGTTSLRYLSMSGRKIPATFTHGLGRGWNAWDSPLEEIDVTNWDLSNTTSLEGLFADSKIQKIKGLETWNTSNISNMSQLFHNCINLSELDLSSFDTSNVINTQNMFYQTKSLTTIYVSGGFVNTNFTNISMFDQATNIKGGNGTTYNYLKVNGDYARIDEEGNPGYFTSILDKPYTITYELNNGTGENRTGYTSRDDTFTLVNPTREGYTFLGWTGSNLTEPTVDVEIVNGTKGNLHFIANWKLIENTVISTPSSSGKGRVLPSKQKATTEEQEHNAADEKAVTETESNNESENNQENDSLSQSEDNSAIYTPAQSVTVKQQVRKIASKTLTRGEVAVMTNVLIDVFPQLLTDKQEIKDNNECISFADEASFTSAEKSAATRLCKLGIMGIHGDTKEQLDKFEAKKNATNNEFIMVIDRLLSSNNDKEISTLRNALKDRKNNEEGVKFRTVLELFIKIKNAIKK